MGQHIEIPDWQKLIDNVFIRLFNRQRCPVELIIKQLEENPKSFTLHYILAKYYRLLKIDRGYHDEIEIYRSIVQTGSHSVPETIKNVDIYFDKIEIKFNKFIAALDYNDSLYFYKYVLGYNPDSALIFRFIMHTFLFNKKLECFYKAAINYRKKRPNSKRLKLYYVIAFLIKLNCLPDFIINIIEKFVLKLK